MVRLICGVLVVVSAVGCSRTNVPAEPNDTTTPPPNSTGLTPEQQTEWNRIEQLEAEAKTLARVDGCLASADCRTAGVGSRACGGPRYYIPWCARTADSAALARKLDEVAKAEQAYNTKHQLASTCEMRLAPAVESSGGSCVTK